MCFDIDKTTCIADLRRVYNMRVPKMFRDYCDSGSYTESTWKNNERAYAKWNFRQKVLVDMDNRSLKTEILGETRTMPVVLAPIGLMGMQRAEGEILAAKAAESFGVPFTLSTMSVCSIEDVARNTSKPFWFQLYMMKDREFMKDLIGRAKAANCSALVLTVDLQMMGQRHKDIKNGLSTPPKPTLVNLLNMCTKPTWCWKMLQTDKREFRNLVGHVQGLDNMKDLPSWTAEQFDPCLSWDDVAWVKEQWGGKLVIKGVMEKEDAILASEAGADAIVVSNHGGRQLDGAPATITVLPEIVEALRGSAKAKSSTEIWVDGGIKTGQDILKAKALGADAVEIGRAYVYGLGAYGQEGVTKALSLLYKELDVSMAFCGHRDINKVDASILRDAEVFHLR